MQGKLITFEGIDGSGKSTQHRMLVGELRSRGRDVLATHEPGGTPLGRRLREVFLETEEMVAPMAELLLFAADRAQHVELLIRPALADGRIVISDRFVDATVAYQGGGRLFGRKTVEKVIKLATGGLSPDLTLYFDIPVEQAIARISERISSTAKTDRMDLETAEFYSRVREEYLAIAKREPERFVVIDASGSIEETHRVVMDTIDRFLEDDNV
ncbi:dTMP kinase [Leptolyngbya sp. 7M]|uniref:dTMP kinase n=1 Tax=Leptolyngbya sp. 7M TaxID=2812896 RepID=UPI001B8D781C|nr:dTMP kinase [Leptolyngbya sp. 7M]QYO66864.1 dTMP kinase [Leptolyngbya sp. 7M]